LITPC